MTFETINLQSRIRKEVSYFLPITTILTGFSAISNEIQLTGQIALIVELQSFVTLEEI